MRESYFPRIIFVGILLLNLSCSDKNKPKERAQSKDTVISTSGVVNDTLKARGQKTEDRGQKIEPKAKKEHNQLPKIVLIITSQACDCTLERCAEGEKIVNEVVQQFPKKLTFERLDYAKEQGQVTQLTKEYQLRFLPALLFFDEKGTFNGKLDGSLDKGEIEKKLKELGVE